MARDDEFILSRQIESQSRCDTVPDFLNILDIANARNRYEIYILMHRICDIVFILVANSRQIFDDVTREVDTLVLTQNACEPC